MRTQRVTPRGLDHQILMHNSCFCLLSPDRLVQATLIWNSKATALSTSRWIWLTKKVITRSSWLLKPRTQGTWRAQTFSWSVILRFTMLKTSSWEAPISSTSSYQQSTRRLTCNILVSKLSSSARISEMSYSPSSSLSNPILAVLVFMVRFPCLNQRSQPTWRNLIKSSLSGPLTTILWREKHKRLKLMKVRSNLVITSLLWDLMVLTQWSCMELAHILDTVSWL